MSIFDQILDYLTRLFAAFTTIWETFVTELGLS